jgi:hypothetical protein
MFTFCVRIEVSIAKIDNIHYAAAERTFNDPMDIILIIYIAFEIFKGFIFKIINRPFGCTQTKSIIDIYVRHYKKTIFMENLFFILAIL